MCMLSVALSGLSRQVQTVERGEFQHALREGLIDLEQVQTVLTVQWCQCWQYLADSAGSTVLKAAAAE